MGNILFPCSPEKEESGSTINLSESCVDRLTREEKESDETSQPERLNIPSDVSEKEWIIKLKCLDDAHSNLNGLTVHAFYKLLDEVESQIEPIREGVCSGDEIVQCLHKNPCCAIKCRAAMENYIDCIDTFRVNIIKEQIECELKEKRKEEQNIVEQFLKNETDEC